MTEVEKDAPVDEGRRNFLKMVGAGAGAAMLPPSPAGQAVQAIERLMNPVHAGGVAQAASYFYRTHLDIFNSVFFANDSEIPRLLQEVFTKEYCVVPFVRHSIDMHNLSYFLDRPERLSLESIKRGEVDVSLLRLDAKECRLELQCRTQHCVDALSEDVQKLEHLIRIVKDDPIGYEVALEQLDRDMLDVTWRLLERDNVKASLGDLKERVQEMLSQESGKGGLMRQLFSTGANGRLHEGNWLEILNRRRGEQAPLSDFFVRLKKRYLDEIEKHAQSFHNLTGEMVDGLSQEMSTRVRSDFEDRHFDDAEWEKLHDRFAREHAGDVRRVVREELVPQGGNEDNTPAGGWKRFIEAEKAGREKAAENNR